MLSNTDIEAKKQQDKIAAKRRINEQRLERLNDPKFRFGVKKEYLDEQVRERKLQKEKEQEIQNLELEQTHEINAYLNSLDDDEGTTRRVMKEEMLQDWEKSIQLKKERLAAMDDRDYDFSKIGAAAAQLRNKRVTNPRSLSREEFLEENNKLREIARATNENRVNEEKEYHELMKSLTTMLDTQERDEEEAKAELAKSIKFDNLELARLQKERRQMDRAQAKVSMGLVKGLVNEEKNAAFNEHGKLVRKDLFKGFTVKQYAETKKQNEDVARFKQSEKEDDKKLYDDFLKMQDDYRTLIERKAEMEEKVRRDEERAAITAAYHESLERKASRPKHHQETPSNDGFNFLDNFGKNAR